MTLFRVKWQKQTRNKYVNLDLVNLINVDNILSITGTELASTRNGKLLYFPLNILKFFAYLILFRTLAFESNKIKLVISFSS